MPTENRSSNTDPRDVFIRLNPLGLGEAELRKDSTGFEDQRTHSDYLLFLAGYRETHSESLQHTEQHQGEPVALPERHVHEHHGCFLSERQHGWNACLDEIAKLGPLYTRPVQGEPVAWQDPDNDSRMCTAEHKAYALSKGGAPAAALATLTRPLYTRADPGEVERLRDELEIVKNNDLKWRGLREQEAEIENLRAQLAEQESLLRDSRGCVQDSANNADCAANQLLYTSLLSEIDVALSASAEPRPFRIPDCPDCACVQDGQCLCSPSKPSAEPIEQATHSCGLDVVSRCVACAKPSAPVEIDERPEGCCCPPKGYNGLWAAGPCPVHQG
ncbi:hypothetical protein WCE04_13785 [Pseudomonas shirazica]|uniref:hypothetical protein n=1 Tax=Pseudomonas shirazica TaxID=1940636 RepID=UPI0034D44711